jgi:transposase
MTVPEMIMEIKYLAREGVPKARIARQCGVSRQTVYNLLERTELRPHRRPRRTSKLDPFKAYLRARLEKFDMPASSLFREVKQQGFTGGITILREYVAPLKAEFTRRVTERFETVPGQQAQIDWGECGTVAVDGERRKLYVFVMVLGYSRMMYARFTTSSRLPALQACLVRAFDRLGIPAELLVDNMKQVVERHDVENGVVHWNPTFLDFAHHHETHPLASPPYWPRVKGKVERGVGYVKRSFLEGRAFVDLDDLNQQLEVWLDTVANVRVHGTTKARPVDRFALEQTVMRPLAAVPAYDVRPIVYRQVHADSHFSYGGVRYSVDPVAVQRTVVLRPEGDRIGAWFSVYLGERLVARHRRRPRHSPPVTLASHEEAIRRRRRHAMAPRAPRRQPRFEQRQAAAVVEGWLRPVVSPTVQVRSLQAYDALAAS